MLEFFFLVCFSPFAPFLPPRVQRTTTRRCRSSYTRLVYSHCVLKMATNENLDASSPETKLQDLAILTQHHREPSSEKHPSTYENSSPTDAKAGHAISINEDDGEHFHPDPFTPFNDLPPERSRVITIRAVVIGCIAGALVNSSNVRNCPFPDLFVWSGLGGQHYSPKSPPQPPNFNPRTHHPLYLTNYIY